KVAASTVWEILKASGINPAQGRTGPTWPQFLRSQAEAILACDFFTAGLLNGTQAYVLTVIEHATRRIRILGVTLHPTGEWTAQQARNLLMDLDDQTHRVKFMIRDRGSNFTAAFDAVLTDAGIRTVLCNVRTPRMNAITERWIGGCRRELLDRTHLEPDPPATDPAPVRDPPQSAPATPLPARRRATETATRTGPSRRLPRPKTGSLRWHDQRISPGRMTWTRFSARTGLHRRGLLRPRRPGAGQVRDGARRRGRRDGRGRCRCGVRPGPAELLQRQEGSCRARAARADPGQAGPQGRAQADGRGAGLPGAASRRRSRAVPGTAGRRCRGPVRRHRAQAIGRARPRQPAGCPAGRRARAGGGQKPLARAPSPPARAPGGKRARRGRSWPPRGGRPGWPALPRGPPSARPQTGATAQQRSSADAGWAVLIRLRPVPARHLSRRRQERQPSLPGAAARRAQPAHRGDGSADALPCPCPASRRIPRPAPVLVPR